MDGGNRVPHVIYIVYVDLTKTMKKDKENDNVKYSENNTMSYRGCWLATKDKDKDKFNYRDKK